jgi:Ion channel
MPDNDSPAPAGSTQGPTSGRVIDERFLKLKISGSYRRARQAARVLYERIPAKVYGIAYLLCIPAFALKYSTIPHGFYQSNIRVESTYSEHGTEILDQLCDALRDHLLRKSGKELNSHDASDVSVQAGGDTFKPTSDLYCQRLGIVDEDRIRFSVVVRLLHRANPPYRVSFVATLAPIEERDPTQWPTQSGRTYIYRRVDMSLSEPKSDYDFTGERIANAVLDTGPEGSFRFPLILLDPVFDHSLKSFMDEANGFTSDAKDNLSRMMYLSAVTITTLGFGDIVPVTPEARWWVTAEAVTGVILIGLFLNAVARLHEGP